MTDEKMQTFQAELKIVFETLDHIPLPNNEEIVRSIYDAHARRVMKKHGVDLKTKHHFAPPKQEAN